MTKDEISNRRAIRKDALSNLERMYLRADPNPSRGRTLVADVIIFVMFVTFVALVCVGIMLVARAT